MVFSEADLLLQEIMPHQAYKYKPVIEKIAEVLWATYSKFGKLQEEKIRKQTNLKETFKTIYGLAGDIGVMFGENQHTNPQNKFTLNVAELQQQISSLADYLLGMTKALILMVSLTQADLEMNESHPLSISMYIKDKTT